MRKITVLFVGVFVLFNSLFSQSSWCGTVPSESFYKSYSEQDRSNYQSHLASRDGIRWIPVWYHIIMRTDGTGGINLKDVFIAHCEMNDYFNPFDIGLFIQGVDTIKDTNLWEYQDSDLGWDAFSTYNRSNNCNVYVNGNLPGLCGFATLPGMTANGGGIFLNKGCVGANEKTFAHEMGHYLGLLHTFDDWGGIEYVNGSNCSHAGDHFCDTPADFLSERTSCPYLGNQTDPNGDLYRIVIDPTLIMSYFADNCVNRFSPMQQAEMNRVLSQERNNLLSIAPPDLSAPSSVQMIFPKDGDLTVNSTNVVFKWYSVPGVRFYNVRIQSSSSPIVLNDTIVTDTFFISNLAAGKKYRFFVKAISYGNACGSDAPYVNIQTSTLRTSISVTSPSCLNGADGKGIVTPVNGNGPYTFQWEDGTVDSINYNLSTGNYFVTVMDNSGTESIAFVSVGAPTPVAVNFNISSNIILALATGGTVPYSFIWSNGVNGQYNSNPVQGNSYTVTVTDAKGCTSVKNIFFTAIGDELAFNIQMKVYPNPASDNSNLNLMIELEERSNAQISLFNINGELVSQMNRELVSGESLLALHVGNLPSGVYVIQLQTKKATRTERLTVIR